MESSHNPTLSQSSKQLSAQLVPLLLQLARLIRSAFTKQYAQLGLSETKAAILEVVHEKSSILSQKELAAELNLSESNVCGLIERMRKEGLLVRCRSNIDRRKSVLRLTEEGASTLRDVQQLHREAETELAATLSLDSALPVVQQLRQSLEQLESTIVSEDAAQSQRRVA